MPSGLLRLVAMLHITDEERRSVERPSANRASATPLLCGPLSKTLSETSPRIGLFSDKVSDKVTDKVSDKGPQDGRVGQALANVAGPDVQTLQRFNAPTLP